MSWFCECGGHKHSGQCTAPMSFDQPPGSLSLPAFLVSSSTLSPHSHIPSCHHLFNYFIQLPMEILFHILSVTDLTDMYNFCVLTMINMVRLVVGLNQPIKKKEKKTLLPNLDRFLWYSFIYYDLRGHSARDRSRVSVEQLCTILFSSFASIKNGRSVRLLGVCNLLHDFNIYDDHEC